MLRRCSRAACAAPDRSKAVRDLKEAKHITNAIAAYSEAVRLDPGFALALAGRSRALARYAAEEAATSEEARASLDRSRADASLAVQLAPDLAQAHLAMASIAELNLEFSRARAEYERAAALGPGNAEVLRASGDFAAFMGDDRGLAAARRGVVLDPLAHESHMVLARALYSARRYGEAATAYAEVLSLEPGFEAAYGERGLALYAAGELRSARETCEARPEYWESQQCLAIVYGRLGRTADAVRQLEKMTAAGGDTGASQYATIYAQWGNHPRALDWLQVAMQLRDPGLVQLKTDSLLDPLRIEPRFRTMMRELEFPE